MARLTAVALVIFSIAAMVVHLRSSSSRIAYRLSQVQKEQLGIMRRRVELQMRIAALRSPGRLRQHAVEADLPVVPPSQRHWPSAPSHLAQRPDPVRSDDY